MDENDSPLTPAKRLWLAIVDAQDRLVVALKERGEYEMKNVRQSREKTPKIFTHDWILTSGAGLMLARKTRLISSRLRQKFQLHRSW
jgi:hypothetical protein